MTDPNDLAFIEAAGTGELMAIEFNQIDEHVEILDIWDPGHTGSPSRDADASAGERLAA